MSYEYNAANGRFEISNPYRIENLAVALCGGVASLAGIALLIGHREALALAHGGGVMAVVVGLALLALGIVGIGRAMVQLRYFFGRGRPRDLSNIDDETPGADARVAQWLKENLRQNALVYREPSGAIAGVLHHVFKDLIFAPREIRAAAETQAFNLLLTLAILLGLGATLFFYPASQTTSWIAGFFGVLMFVMLLRPMLRKGTAYTRARAGIAFVIMVIAVPILVPPFLERFVANWVDISGLQLPRTVLLSVLVLLAAQALFFIALVRQIGPRPAINMACEQRSINMNANPAKLFEELERLLQTRWVEGIPNRRYAAKKLPDVLAGESGSFHGEAMEETQPLPKGASAQTSIKEQITLPVSRGLTGLTALAALCFLVATAVGYHLADAQIGGERVVSLVALAVTLFFSGIYCLQNAHLLWGRVDFSSVLLWVELQGSFEEAQINIGNQLASAMSSSKRVINVESMTMRVWVAELDSVILSKDGRRDLIGMQGRPDLAVYFADHLQGFAQQAPSVVSPASATDQQRLAQIGQTQRSLGGAIPNPLLSSSQSPAMPSQETTAAQGTAKPLDTPACRNPQCGKPVAADALFCSACGTKVAA